jgi:hypothetical protein
MGTILVIVIAILLFGAGGGYYGFRQYGGPGVGGAIVLVVLAFLVVWLAGGLSSDRGGSLGSATPATKSPVFMLLGIH